MIALGGVLLFAGLFFGFAFLRSFYGQFYLCYKRWSGLPLSFLEDESLNCDFVPILIPIGIIALTIGAPLGVGVWALLKGLKEKKRDGKD